MANNYNITCEAFTQSQIFKNILSVGTKMASFLHQAEFESNQQSEIAVKLMKDWSNTCEEFAKQKWEAIQYEEIIEDITEYLAKTKAMVNLALKANFCEVSAETLHNYFGELKSLIMSISLVLEDLIGEDNELQFKNK